MKLYVLDTNVCGFVQNEHQGVMGHLHEALARGDQVVTTIVTFGEDLGGWLPACRRAAHGPERASLCTLAARTDFLPNERLPAFRRYCCRYF